MYRREGELLRQIDPSFADAWDAYTESGLYDRLVDAGVMIPHEEVALEHAAEPPAHKVVRPERIEVISYPYEWSFGQLKDAALLTLQAQAMATEAGMTMRDATAYNVQFRRGRPVLIDSLSFEPAEPGRPWSAYRQFCEQFLAPLALMAKMDVRLGRLQRDYLDGIPLDLAASLLPRRTRLTFGLGPHLHLHARAQRTHADDNTRPGEDKVPTMSHKRLVTLNESLRDTVEGLDWTPEGTAWADYADHTSYDDAATVAKERAVADMLQAAGGSCAWDLGANTGRYSRIATDHGYRVVALDSDPAAVERAYRTIRRDDREDILPLLADLTSPSPALGWGSAERIGLLDRIDTDVILALALVHHLAIGANVPLPMIAAQFAGMATHAIVEWVPREDAMVQRLLASRKDVFATYDIDSFRAATEPYFLIMSERPIEGTERTLFHLQRRTQRELA